LVSKYWLATEKYVHAYELLIEENRAEEAESMTNTSSKTNLVAKQQVAKLYASQVDEYWKKSRECLVKAMEEESALESCASLDDDQAEDRNRSFAALVVKTAPEEPLETDAELPEDGFEATSVLLTAAERLESVSKYWLTTEKYVHAYKLMTLLAEETRAEAEAMTNTSSESYKGEARQQVAKLYASHADEYFKKSRACLIKALEEESTLESRESLDGDQARARNRSFAVLFSKPVEEETKLLLEQTE